jgi:hypothetical protein
MGEIRNMREHGVMEYVKIEDFRKIDPKGKQKVSNSYLRRSS